MKKETVEIVRCKDCLYWDRSWKSRNNINNKTYRYCPIADQETESNFYCADGAVRYDFTWRHGHDLV